MQDAINKPLPPLPAAAKIDLAAQEDEEYRVLAMDIWEKTVVRAGPENTYPLPMTAYVRPQQTGSLVARPYSWEKYGPQKRDGWNNPRGDADEASKKKKRSPLLFLFRMYGKSPEDVKALEDAPSQPITHPVGWKRFLILLSGAIPYIVVVLDDTIIATIIPVLVSEFHDPVDIGWYASAYFLPLTVLMPVFGKCYSFWKIRWLFVLSLLILLGGSVVCATTSSSLMFIAGRATSGAGAAGIVNGAMRIIGISTSRKVRTFFEAAGALAMGGATVAGPLLGGVIADSIGWRWAFRLNIPIAVSALIIVLLVFPDQPPATALFSLPLVEKLKRLDPVGSLTLIGTLCCLIALLESLATGFGTLSMQDRALAIVTGVLFVVFVVHETFVRADLALVPRKLLRYRVVWSCCIMLFFLFAGFINFVFFLSVFFQSVQGATAQQSAVSLLPYIITVSVAAMVVGVGVFFVHYYNPFFIIGGVIFALGSGLIFTFDDETTPLKRSIYESILGVGVGLIMLGNVAPCHIQLDEKDHSEANGFLFLSSLLGATLSLPISNTLFNHDLIRGTLLLSIPSQAKLAAISNPTTVHSTVSAEFLPAVLDVLANSIRKTFLLGLVCAIACAIATLFVPFKRLIVDNKKPESRDANIVQGMKRASAVSVIPVSWIQQNLAEEPRNVSRTGRESSETLSIQRERRTSPNPKGMTTSSGTLWYPQAYTSQIATEKL